MQTASSFIALGKKYNYGESNPVTESHSKKIQAPQIIIVIYKKIYVSFQKIFIAPNIIPDCYRI